jgi:type III secretory pathway component EscR
VTLRAKDLNLTTKAVTSVTKPRKIQGTQKAVVLTSSPYKSQLQKQGERKYRTQLESHLNKELPEPKKELMKDDNSWF